MTPAAQFFAALYAGQTGMLELRTFGPEEADRTPRARQQRAAAYALRTFASVEGGVLDMARVERFLAGCASAELGAFFGVALRTRAAAREWKGDAAHCQSLSALFVDADFKHVGETETRRRLADFQTPPSLVVNSGGGLHPYWLLDQPLDLRAYEAARLILRRLAYTVAAIADVSVSEPARVLRVPGSLNFKYSPPRPVVVEQLSDVRIDPADLRLIELTASSGAASGRSSGIPFRLPAALSALKKERHETMRLLLRSLQAHGLSTGAAVAICVAENRARCHPPLEDATLESYLRRASAYADAPDFVRAPKEGWLLAAALLELGLSAETTRAVVRAVTPDFDEPDAGTRRALGDLELG